MRSIPIQEIISAIEEWAPVTYAEDFDNVGLLVGDPNLEISSALITLDTTEAVINEAIEKKCGLIISFHPPIFKPIERLNGNTMAERCLIKAIENRIALYALHTNLDVQQSGVNKGLCERLGLLNPKILIPKKGLLRKLITYVPVKQAESLLQALFEAGAGTIGNYNECSFSFDGHGSFKASSKATPFIGNIGVRHTEAETCIYVVFPKHLQSKVLNALKKAHPYEEVAYEVYTLENAYQGIGMGMIGDFNLPISEMDFLALLKNRFQTKCIRHSAFLNRSIKRVAVVGGSGTFALKAAKQSGADALVTSDFKYHDFFKASNEILMADVGHYESEAHNKWYIKDHLNQKISNFAFSVSQINTNPINYYS